MPRPKTQNRGAADIIARVISKVKRMAVYSPASEPMIPAQALIDWLRDWDKRAKKRKGGL